MRAPDQNVERNRQLLLDRSLVGLKKYGVTTERNDLTFNDWLQHLLEELLDAANYVQAAKTANALAYLQMAELGKALEFYASGNHFVPASQDDFDTVTDEPQNWLYAEAAEVTIEDGGIAMAALAAHRRNTHAASPAALDVLAERQRQINAEGWTPEHDDEHASDEIAAFAALYAMPEACRDWDARSTGYGNTLAEAITPEGWQPKLGDRRRELIKAGALIIAEIERLDRAAQRHGGAQ